jgi:hypothetical protein
MATSSVEAGPDVTIWPSVTEGAGVTTYQSVISGDTASYLLLQSGGIFLLMTNGGLLLV